MSMRRAWPGGICRLLGIVLLPLMGCAAPSPPAPSPPAPLAASSATSTSFSPPSVSLGAGESTTIAIMADGLSAGDTAAQFGVVHNNANTTISNAQCVGIFSGANPNQAAQATGDLLACTYPTGGASGTSGDVMTVTLTNIGGGTETISFNTAMTLYLSSAVAPVSPGTTNTLTVTSQTAR
jgi:hypothetical protein